MNITPISKATNIDEIIFNFKQDRPLTPENKEEWETIYTPTHRKEVERLLQTLIKSPPGENIFFGGHAGNGKSTELNRILEDPRLQKQFSLVKFDIKDYLNPLDLEIVELFLLVAFQLLEYGKEHSLSPVNKLQENLERITQFFREELKIETIETKARSGEMEGKSSLSLGVSFWGFLKIKTDFLAKMKGQAESREVLRKQYRPRMNELINLINDLISWCRPSKKEKPLLLIIDGLDRIPPQKAKKLYIEDGQNIFSLKASVLMTLPMAMIYSVDESILKNTLGPIIVLKNPRLKSKGGGKDEEAKKNISTLKSLILNRLNQELITEEALDLAIQYSGGVFRTLFQLIAEAAIESSIDEKKEITMTEMEEVIKEERIRKSRPLGNRQWETLLHIAEHNAFPDTIEQEQLNLLHGLYALEYANGGDWCDISPFLEEPLEEYKKYKKRLKEKAKSQDQ